MKNKFRRPTLAKAGFQVGNTGTSASFLMFGTVSGCVPQLTASGTVATGSFFISNLPAGATIFLQGLTACPSVVCTAASVTSASIVSASFQATNAAATGASVPMSFHYLAIG